jgi:hypothetical protein
MSRVSPTSPSILSAACELEGAQGVVECLSCRGVSILVGCNVKMLVKPLMVKFSRAVIGC